MGFHISANKEFLFNINYHLYQDFFQPCQKEKEVCLCTAPNNLEGNKEQTNERDTVQMKVMKQLWKARRLHPPASPHAAVEAVHSHGPAAPSTIVTAPHSALITWQEKEIHILGPGSSQCGKNRHLYYDSQGLVTWQAMQVCHERVIYMVIIVNYTKIKTLQKHLSLEILNSFQLVAKFSF